MTETFHGNPEGNQIRMTLVRGMMRLFGWRVVGIYPDTQKFVVIIAPHTSAWDFVVGMGVIAAFGGKVRWLGKDSLFKPYFAWFFRWWGGIPVDRNTRHNFIQRMTDLYNSTDHFILAIAPEGTRTRSEYWRTGFYYIAYQAKVPIVLVFFDYKRKMCGIKGVVMPTGDIKADIAIIREFYAGVGPKHPEHFGEIRVAK